MKKVKRRIVALLLACGLTCSVTACNNNAGSSALSEATSAEVSQAAESSLEQTDIKGQEMIPVTENLSADIKAQYTSTDAFEYTEPLLNLAPDHQFIFDLGFNPEEAEYSNKNEYDQVDYKPIMDIFVDRDFTISIDPAYQKSNKSNKIRLEPSQSIYDPTEETGQIAFYQDRSGSWGYANEYFLVVYRDLLTGKELEKPLVTIFTIDRQVTTPYLEFVKTSNGYASYRWNKVEDAESYVLMMNSKSPHSNYMNMILAETTDTTYVDVSDLRFTGSAITLTNIFYQGSLDMSSISVYAVDADGNYSLASNPIYIDSVQHLLPYIINIKEEQTLIFENYNDVYNFIPVEMCDGSIVEYSLQIVAEDAEMVSLEHNGETIDALYVPIKARATDLSSYLCIINFDENTIAEDLNALEERLISAQGASGAPPSPSIEIGGSADTPIQPPVRDDSSSEESSKESSQESSEESSKESSQESSEESSREISTENNSKLGNAPFSSKIGEYTVYGSDALTAYIAYNMLNGVEYIDLSEFPEATSTEIIVDAFYEAIYQNPLVLSVHGMRAVPESALLLVGYKQDTVELFAKQKEINQTVEEIVAEIIKPNMTAIEKELAINEYLCDTAVYDTAALDSALENDMRPDDSFKDSFTPYGILVNKVGVCASYASSFKLLADKAGLDSIVVNGYLNGDLAHAWNRVLIEGEWVSLDVTNNDNPMFGNAYFNLSDNASKSVLVEDDSYILNVRQKEFTASTDEYEYFRLTDNFYDTDKVVPTMITEFNTNKEVLLRTDTMTPEKWDEVRTAFLQGITVKLTEEEAKNTIVYSENGIVYIGKIKENN